MDENAAARAEWQLVEVDVLRKLSGHLVCLNRTGRRLIADREAADLACRAQVPFDECRRDVQCVGHVVKPLADFVGRQQRGDAHSSRQAVERQQIADRVLKFGAVEAMDRRNPAGVRTGRGGAIE